MMIPTQVRSLLKLGLLALLFAACNAQNVLDGFEFSLMSNNVESGNFCLAVGFPENNRIFPFKCDGSPSQKFEYTVNNQIRSTLSGECLRAGRNRVGMSRCLNNARYFYTFVSDGTIQLIEERNRVLEIRARTNNNPNFLRNRPIILKTQQVGQESNFFQQFTVTDFSPISTNVMRDSDLDGNDIIEASDDDYYDDDDAV